ncbi:hypothetical protein A5706_12250 [Mycobacterium sp. E796]|nr:hypothetical protein A5706_12250 [Mycobacterium sp. E796]
MVDAVKSHRVDLRQVGQVIPEFGSCRGQPKKFLSLIDPVWHLLDELFSHQGADNNAQRCSFYLQYRLQFALHGGTHVRELIQHVPLGGAEAIRPQSIFHRDARSEIAPLSPSPNRLRPVHQPIVSHLTILLGS